MAFPTLISKSIKTTIKPLPSLLYRWACFALCIACFGGSRNARAAHVLLQNDSLPLWGRETCDPVAFCLASRAACVPTSPHHPPPPTHASKNELELILGYTKDEYDTFWRTEVEVFLAKGVMAWFSTLAGNLEAAAALDIGFDYPLHTPYVASAVIPRALQAGSGFAM